MAIKRTFLTTVAALVLIIFVMAPAFAFSSSGSPTVAQPADSSNTAVGTPALILTGPSDVNVTENFTLTATLKEANGNSRPNTLVTFTADGAAVGTATTDASGVASFSQSDSTAHAVTYAASINDAGTAVASNSVTIIVHAPSHSPSGTPSPSAQPTSSPSVSPSPEPSATPSASPRIVTPNAATSDTPKSTAASSYSDPPDPTLSPTTSQVSKAEQSNNAVAAQTFEAPWLASSAIGSDPQGANSISVELTNCTTTVAEPISTTTSSQTSLVYAPTWLAPMASSSVSAEAATMSAVASVLQGSSGPTPCVTPTATGQTSQTAPNLTLPAAQTNGAAGLPTQSVFEFSALGLGAPALLVGLLYLLLRRV